MFALMHVFAQISYFRNGGDAFSQKIERSLSINYIFALTKILKCRSLFRRKVGKFGVTIEIKFIDVMTAFIDKKI